MVGVGVPGLTAGLIFLASRLNAKASPYEAIAKRVVHLEEAVPNLEKRIDELEAENVESRDLVTRLLNLLEKHQIEVPASWLPGWVTRKR